MNSAANQWAAAIKRSKAPGSSSPFDILVARAKAKAAPSAKGPAPKAARKGAPDTSPLEYYSQAMVAKFLDWSGLLWCHVGNERVKRSEAGKLASQGIKRGVPDILIFSPLPCGRLSGMAIELKRISRKAIKNPVAGASEDQLQWGQGLQDCGWRWRISYGHLEAIREIILAYKIELNGAQRALYLEER